MTAQERRDAGIKKYGSGLGAWYRDVYLNSKHWRELKEEKFRRHGKKCQRCGSKRRLQVHHIEYHNIYDVEIGDLEVLCDRCHRNEHGIVIAPAAPRQASPEDQPYGTVTISLDDPSKPPLLSSGVQCVPIVLPKRPEKPVEPFRPWGEKCSEWEAQHPDSKEARAQKAWIEANRERLGLTKPKWR